MQQNTCGTPSEHLPHRTTSPPYKHPHTLRISLQTPTLMSSECSSVMEVAGPGPPKGSATAWQRQQELKEAVRTSAPLWSAPGWSSSPL